jgi:hypothetical protein
LTLEREHKATLGAKGACDLVCKVLETYRSQAAILGKALNALVHLTVEMDQNIYRFGTAGGCELVCQTMRHHSAHRIVNLYGCQAVMHLARRDENRQALGAAGACQAVYHSITHFIAAIDGASAATCPAGSHSHEGEQPSSWSRKKKGVRGGKEEMPMDAASLKAWDEKIVLHAVWAIVALASANDNNKRTFNKIETRALLMQLQASLPPGNAFFASKIKNALDRLNSTRSPILKKKLGN